MEAQRAYEQLKADFASLPFEEVSAMPVWKKFEMVGQLTAALRASIREGLSARYPLATDEELRRRFGIVWLGPALAKSAFGWEVDEDDTDLMIE